VILNRFKNTLGSSFLWKMSSRKHQWQKIFKKTYVVNIWKKNNKLYNKVI